MIVEEGGTTLEKSILRMLDRLNPKKIIRIKRTTNSLSRFVMNDGQIRSIFIAFKACTSFTRRKGRMILSIKNLQQMLKDLKNISDKKIMLKISAMFHFLTANF